MPSLDFKAASLTVSGWHLWEEQAVWAQEADGACGWDAVTQFVRVLIFDV